MSDSRSNPDAGQSDSEDRSWPLVIAEARSIGYRKLVLDTLADMKEARALYAGLGFREIPAYYDNPLPGVLYAELDLGR